MAAAAPAFDACGLRIAEDPVKGKVVFSEREIRAGEVIFSEEAFVFAPWTTNVCDGCEEEKSPEHAECYCDRTGKPKELYSPFLSKDVEKRNEIVQLMAQLEGIAEVDRARCILKCVAMFERDHAALDQVLQLTCANFEDCLDDVKNLRDEVPEIFPEGFSNEQMATLIGVLNTNSHELENLGGSGLFLSACRMEHNCLPNCSFTTYDSTLWMTAIRPIAKGEALSIDYGNFFYRPTEERLSSLLESYGFMCSCDSCIKEPDVCRSFKCGNASCTTGAVWPYPQTPSSPLTDPEDLEFVWKCNECGYAPSEEEIDGFEEAEEALLEDGFPETLAEVDEYLKTSPLHERHYLLFWAMDAIGCEAAALNNFVDDESHRVELAEVWQRIIAYMNVVVPYAHHEKTIYYDNLAQVQVVLGNRNAAMDAYNKAFEVACIVSGRDCAPTQKLKDLADDPPADAEALRKVYANVKRRETGSDDEDEVWEDEEDEEDGDDADQGDE